MAFDGIGKFFIGVLLFTAMISGVSAASPPEWYYDFSPDRSYPPTDATLTVYDLAPNHDYELEYYDESQNLKDKLKFSTDSFGKAKVSLNYEPFNNNVEFEPGGYAYQITDPNNWSEKLNMNPAGTFEHFDSTNNSEVADGYETDTYGTNEDQTGSWNEDNLRMQVYQNGGVEIWNRYWNWEPDSESVVLHGEFIKGSDNLQFRLFYEDPSDSGGDGHRSVISTLNLDTTSGDGPHRYLVNMTQDNLGNGATIQAYRDGSQVSTVSVNSSVAKASNLNYALRAEQGGTQEAGVEVYSIETVPNHAAEYYHGNKIEFPTGSIEIQEIPQALKISSEYSTDSTTTQFVDDLGVTDFLRIVNLGDSLDAIAVEGESKNVFSNVKPADGRIINRNELQISFNFDAPEGYTNGFLKPQFKVNGTWETQPATYKGEGACLGVLGSVQFDDGVQLDTVTCDGGTQINATIDVSEVKDSRVWRLVYDTRNIFFSSKKGVFYSEEKRFLRSVRQADLTLIYPPDGSTVTNLKPNFEYRVNTIEGGNLELVLNKTGSGSAFVEKSYVFGSPVSQTFSYSTNIALDDSTTYNWWLEFQGTSGTNSQSQKYQFKTNTSKSSDVNISFDSPADGAEIVQRNANLQLDVDTTNSGNLTVYLNEKAIAEREINAGSTDNISVPIVEPEVQSYDSYATFTSGGTVYQQEGPEFEVIEDVSLSIVRPDANTTQIDQPPVVFEARLNTSSPGELKLFVDGKNRGTKTILSGFNGTKTYEVSENLKSGKHTFKFRFDSGVSDNTFDSEVREFNLELGSEQVQRSDGGSVGDLLHNYIGSRLGLDLAGTLAIFSVLFSIAGAVITGVETENGAVASVSFLGILTAMSLAGWFPMAFLIILAVIAAAIFARMVST